MDKVMTVRRGTPEWLDSLAVSMSMICAVHCMVTPVLIGVLPVLATTFWAHQDFHLWMVLLVVPTTTFSLFVGYRKHRDRLVMLFGSLGLLVLSGVAGYESFLHSTATAGEAASCAICSSCGQAEAGGGFFTGVMVTNLLGAAFLTTAHVRNFVLCRRARCCSA
jgi:hypothetical protein